MRQRAGSEKSRIRRLLSLDWDAIAGVVAAVVAIVMHFLHLIDQGVLLMITVVLLALLFLRGLRREPANGAWSVVWREPKRSPPKFRVR